jgi:hypothetical protein
MAFTVEDGTGLAASNAYASLAEFETWAEDRGVDISALSDEQVQKGLMDAAVWIDAHKFVGEILSLAQALSWPRTGAYDDQERLQSGVPDRVKLASYELAYQDATGDGLNAPLEAPVASEKVDVIAVSYFEYSSRVEDDYPQVERILAPLVIGTSLGAKVVRV